MRDNPACHVFSVGSDEYAYDLNTQQLLKVEPELAAVLRGDEGGSEAAKEVLREAQENEGLFLAHRPRLVPWQKEPATDVDQGLQHLVLTVTEACNLRCAYCLHGADLDWVRNHSSAQMSVETALKAVAYFLERRDPDRAPVISFYGGEALLNFEVVEAVIAKVRRHLLGSDVVFSIDTNGMLLSDNVISLVLREKIYLQISIDGPAIIHDRHRLDANGQPTFSQIMANLNLLLERDPAAAERLTYVLTLAPPVDLFAVAGLFENFPPYIRRGIETRPNVTVNFANLKGQNWRRNQEQAAGLPSVPDQVNQARTIYLESVTAGKRSSLSPVICALFEPDLARFHHRSRARLGATYTPGGNCRPGRRKLHVTADGQYQPCERTGRMMPLGTIASGIEGVAVKKLYEDFYAAVRDRCGQCWALRLCGVCFAAQAENLDGTTGVGLVPESVCHRVRAQKEVTLKMMVEILAMPKQVRAWLDSVELE